LKYFNEWAKDKPPLIAKYAFLIATSAEDCLELFDDVEKGKRIEGNVHLPRLKNWLKMYNNPEKVIIDLFSSLGNIDNDFIGIKDFYKDAVKAEKELKKMTPEQIRSEIEKIPPEKLKAIIKNSYETYKGLQETFVNKTIADEWKQETEINKDKKEKKIELANKAEVIFFVRVLYPCFLLYRTYPNNLIRKARTGDDDALKKLIRLDKSVIFDPKISEIIHQAQAAKVQEKISIIKKAFSMSPNVKIDRQKIKYTLAGLISFASSIMLHKINAIEINRLFDAIARDNGIGDVDPDLIVTPETFEKAVQRSRAFWQTITPQADKK
jgi:hypothetical protein